MEPEWTQVIPEEEKMDGAVDEDRDEKKEEQQVISEEELLAEKMAREKVKKDKVIEQVENVKMFKTKWKEMHENKFNDIVDLIVTKCSEQFDKGNLTCFVDFTDSAEKGYISCMSLHICNAVYQRLDIPLHCVIFQHMFGARLDVKQLLDLKLCENDRVIQLNTDNINTILGEIAITPATRDRVQLVMDMISELLSVRKGMTKNFAQNIIKKIEEVNRSTVESKSLTKEEKISWILTNMMWSPDIQILKNYVENDGKFKYRATTHNTGYPW